MAERLRPTETVREALSLAGAPTSAAALRTMLADRFGITLPLTQLQTMAVVTDEMLIAPAERPAGKTTKRKG